MCGGFALFDVVDDPPVLIPIPLFIIRDVERDRAKLELWGSAQPGLPLCSGFVSIEQQEKYQYCNAGENHEMDADALFVKNVTVDQGMTIQRWMPRAMGRATPIRKRTAKVTIVVAEQE